MVRTFVIGKLGTVTKEEIKRREDSEDKWRSSKLQYY